jgi:hypothetical protein
MDQKCVYVGRPLVLRLLILLKQGCVSISHKPLPLPLSLPVRGTFASQNTSGEARTTNEQGIVAAEEGGCNDQELGSSTEQPPVCPCGGGPRAMKIEETIGVTQRPHCTSIHRRSRYLPYHGQGRCITKKSDERDTYTLLICGRDLAFAPNSMSWFTFP